MRVFKTTYRDRAGKTKVASRWYIELRDHNETVRRLPAFTDRKQSEECGRRVEKLVACRINRESLTKELRAWVDSLPSRMRDKLAAWGVLESRAHAAGKPLAEHIDDFEAALLAKGGTELHAQQTAKRVRTIADDCEFRTWSDISSSRVQRFLSELREGSDDEAGRGVQTCNYYLQSVKQFCRWMVRDGRAGESPVDHLQRQNARADRRCTRRALSVDEQRRLLAAADAGPVEFGMVGPDRMLLYRLALETGLRANELRSLTTSSFDLDADPATVTVLAGYSKRRRDDELPLRPELADTLRRYLDGRGPDADAFALPRRDQMADMIRRDLAAARLTWLDEASTPAERKEREQSSVLADVDGAGQTVDFHCTRHTFISNLARAGVHPKLAQTLARHSDINLTMGTYTHTTQGEQSAALASLPDLTLPAVADQPQTARATGTDGPQPQSPETGRADLAFCLALQGSQSCNSMHSDAPEVPSAENAATATQPRKKPHSDEKMRGEKPMRLLGLEPRAYGLKVQTGVSVTGEEQVSCGDAEIDLAFCLALLQREKPDLARLVEAWDTLPDDLRGRILAMVEAAGNKSPGGRKWWSLRRGKSRE